MNGVSRWLVLPVLLSLSAVVACASSGGVYSPGRVDAAPRLYGCPNVTNAGPGNTVDVTLSMVVDEEGMVVPGTIRRVAVRSDGPFGPLPAGLVREAMDLALDCKFSAGILDGDPVPVRVEHTMKFAFTGY